MTTVTSCGAVNAAFESLTGLGGAVPFANLSMSEVVFGGVGTGLYSMLVFVLLAVFIGGLMVGRTPEYLGKKIGAREIKLLTLGALFTPLAALMTSATAIASPAGRRVDRGVRARRASPRTSTPTSRRPTTTARRGPATRATSSPSPATSAPTASRSPTSSAALTMVFARFAPILFVLADRRRARRASGSRRSGLGTMRTDTPTFVVLLIGVIVLVGALTFFPAILLGPIVQSLTTSLF